MNEHDDDHDDDLPCYRHPRELTALRCISCGRPICTECAIAAPVGLKCPECGRQSRAALGHIPRGRLLAGCLAAGAAGAAGGFVYQLLGGGFFSLIVAWLLGMGVGEIARRAAGGFRDPALARVAGAAAFLGLLWPLLLDVLASGTGAVSGVRAAFLLIGACIAAVAAAQRAQ